MTSFQTPATQYIPHPITPKTTFAYRQYGAPIGVPLVLLQHFRGTMAHWDPLLLFHLSTTRPVIVFDNAGVGASTGSIAPTFVGWAANAIAFVAALGLTRIDLLGFSMGGCAAQMVALDAPERLVRKLILAGTRASQSGKTVPGPPGPFGELFRAEGERQSEAAFAYSFFPETEQGRKFAGESWARMREANGGKAPVYLGREAAKVQVQAFAEWSTPNPRNSAERLGELKMPVLVCNGDDDVLIPTVNSWELMEGIKDAQLVVYPQAGHGFLDQYAEFFAEHVRLFLDGPGEGEGKARL